MTMSCEEFRQGHPDSTPAAQEHLAGCPDCRTFDRSWELLRELPAIPVPPGFYRGIRRKLAPAILRFAAPIAAAAAALLLALFLTHPASVVKTTPKPAAPSATATEEERELVENLDLLENYEVLRTLEIVGENGSPLHEEKK